MAPARRMRKVHYVPGVGNVSQSKYYELRKKELERMERSFLAVSSASASAKTASPLSLQHTLESAAPATSPVAIIDLSHDNDDVIMESESASTPSSGARTVDHGSTSTHEEPPSVDLDASPLTDMFITNEVLPPFLSDGSEEQVLSSDSTTNISTRDTNTTDREVVPEWAVKLSKDLKYIKRHIDTLPIMLSSLEEIATNVKLLVDHMDRTSRSANEEGQPRVKDCKRILDSVPLTTEEDLLSFNGKLLTDEKFREQFGVWLKRQSEILPVNCTNSVRVSRTLKAMFHENITIFGNWTGEKKVLREDGMTKERTKCLAFRDLHLFKEYLSKYFGGTLELKEWLRNTNGTRLRYHSGGEKATGTRRHPTKNGTPNTNQTTTPAAPKETTTA